VLLVLAIVLGFALFYALIIGVTLATVSVGGSDTSTGSIMGAVFATFGVTLLAFLGGAALFLWLSTKLAFVPAAIVLEKFSVGRAIARSWTLTRGYFWRTLGILLLVEVMVWIATNIVAVPLQLVLSLGATLLDPTGAGSVSPDAVGAGAAVALIVSYAIVSIVSAIGMVLISATWSLLYLDLRMRKEGLDLELARFVEARQTGADVADPYLRG
jgi:membrane-anchored glycerophosphoryl diester phosphodiesterase (GDPDase)